jgi:hypothetical protein
MTPLSSAIDVGDARQLRTEVNCPLCGTRLRRDEQPNTIEMSADTLTTVARHRCAPRVKLRAAVAS